MWCRSVAAVAAKTNLLALNATIEAARAGDAGKGFAVVASEVKTLAQQTAQATEAIGRQVGAIQTSVAGAVAAVQRVTGAIGNVSAISTAIAAAMEEQSAATQEISQQVTTSAQRTLATTEGLETVGRIADGTRDSSREVLRAAGDVARVSDEMRREVNDFLAAMQDQQGNRRRYDPGGVWRCRGDGAAGGGGEARAARVEDISLGGMALMCEGAEAYAAGTAVTVSVEGGGGCCAGGWRGGSRAGWAWCSSKQAAAAIAEAVEWFAGGGTVREAA
jgi:methyl-accepting chemotaxis protein